MGKKNWGKKYVKKKKQFWKFSLQLFWEKTFLVYI